MLRIGAALVCIGLLVAVTAGCGGDEAGEDVTTSVGANTADTTDGTGETTAATGAAADTSDLQAGASDRFVGTWVDMQGNVGPFKEFTLNEDGSAVTTDRDGYEQPGLWTVEEIGQGSWYELKVEAEDGQILDNAVEWVSETEFKRKNADGSWVKQ